LTTDGLSAAARSRWQQTRHFRPVLFLVVVLFVYFSITQTYFFTNLNLSNMLVAVSALWVIAMGMTFVLLSGGADLSVGAIAALAGFFLAKVIGTGLPGGVAVVATIAFGALVGASLNGLLIGGLGLSFFVVTLASSTALTGVVYLWSNTQSIVVTAPIAHQIAINHIAGVPTPIWIMVAVFLVAAYLQRSTYFGRDVYAVGGSLTAARLAGIRPERTLIGVYALTGACAAIGGMIAVGRIGAASPQVEVNLPLQAIAAVLLGGTRLTGGFGGVGGTALGVLFIGILQNGLSIAGVPSFWQYIVTGVILVAAVLGSTGGEDIKALIPSRFRRHQASPVPEGTT
jgi:ribose transport system permease protein